jgi:hypothetical protein
MRKIATDHSVSVRNDIRSPRRWLSSTAERPIFLQTLEGDKVSTVPFDKPKSDLIPISFSGMIKGDGYTDATLYAYRT